MDCTTPVPLEVWVVGMVLTTGLLLKLMTEIPPPVPGIGHVEVAGSGRDGQRDGIVADGDG